ncbi:hypothetical protein AFA91_04975 [Mycolicibacterium goodii]|uniref:Uncharacterized protein n=1 Tax=Mycolicibacterium goodii TaxID=134601 RepID=A0A0K0X1L6_MYCGD|nr:hypothetical protein AFA91_04975 [Mycolicibacterium goodii]
MAGVIFPLDDLTPRKAIFTGHLLSGMEFISRLMPDIALFAQDFVCRGVDLFPGHRVVVALDTTFRIRTMCYP